MKLFRQNKALFALILLFSLSHFVSSQQVNIQHKNTPLNQALVGLRDSFDVNLAFNDERLSKYNITINKTFETPEDALKAMVANLPLRLEKNGDTFLILEDWSAYESVQKEAIALNGLVIDGESGEILPYSTISINGDLRISDFRGRFSYLSHPDSTLAIRASYLGYYVYDTLIIATQNFTCELTHSSLQLNELKVEGVDNVYGNNTGNALGEVRLNHKLATYFAGGINGSVYNILRLQPGINGTNEHARSLSIWGSGAGQNQTRFDGISIYSLNTFVDNFNTINPLLIKDINLYKGGYGSNQGNRVGGIIEVNSIDGNYYKPEIKLSADNQSVNAMIGIPVFKRSALVVAHRRTIFETFNKELQEQFGDFNSDNFADNYVLPNNSYKDLNLKFSGFLNNGDQLFISGFNSRAKSNASLITDFNDFAFSLNKDETMRQSGLAAFYGKLWKKGVSSNIKISYSGFNNHSKMDSSYSAGAQNPNIVLNKNQINELNVSVDNRFSLTRRQFVEAGLEYNHYATQINYVVGEINILEKNPTLDKVSGYVRNNIQANNRLTMDIGVRADYAITSSQLLFQPRIRSNIKLWKDLNLNISWGVYNQFIGMFSLLDPMDNYSFFWSVSGGDDAPYLQSDIFGGALSWTGDGLLINFETYYRRTEGLQQYKNDWGFLSNSTGKSNSSGFDIYLKKDFLEHSIWASYSYNSTEVYYTHFAIAEFVPSPFNVTHEFKTAGIFNFDPLFVSLNYVYGSGISQQMMQGLDEEVPYSRLDGSAFIKFDVGKSEIKTGVNALNILNKKNYPYTARKQFFLDGNNSFTVSNGHQAFFMQFFVSINY